MEFMIKVGEKEKDDELNHYIVLHRIFPADYIQFEGIVRSQALI